MSTPACSHTHGNVIAHVQGCAYGRGSRVPSRTERELQQGSMREQGVELPVGSRADEEPRVPQPLVGRAAPQPQNSTTGGGTTMSSPTHMLA